MIVAIVTFHLPEAKSLAEMSAVFQSTAPRYQDKPGLLRKNYFVSDDGRRAGGIYVWATRADADALFTDAWKRFVEGKYGAAPQIEFLHSPVMVDNRDGTITTG